MSDDFQRAEQKLRNEFRTLIQQIIAAYYDDITMVVIRALLALDEKNPGRIREVELKEALAPLDLKQIIAVLAKWTGDGLLCIDMKDDPVPAGEQKKREYKGSNRHRSNVWFFKPEQVTKVIKYRHHRILEGLSKDVDQASQDLVCPNTGDRAAAGTPGCPDPGPHPIHEVLLRQRDKNDPQFRCRFCFVTQPDGTRKGVVLELSAGCRDELSGLRSKLKAKFNEQLKGVNKQMEVVDRCIMETEALRRHTGQDLVARPSSSSLSSSSSSSSSSNIHSSSSSSSSSSNIHVLCEKTLQDSQRQLQEANSRAQSALSKVKGLGALERRNSELLIDNAKLNEEKKLAENALIYANNHVDLWREQCAERIAYKSISTQDTVLFIQDTEGRYVPYNHNCPHRYLSRESVEAFSSVEKKHAEKVAEGDEKKSTSLLLGRVVEISKHKASVKANPFKVPIGTDYYELVAEILSFHNSSCLAAGSSNRAANPSSSSSSS
eukprot:gb/GEZN01003782.1/.p1 GENE.gb/GEZN01003782.1/~~gb/GEZN01003782.1/.p1  ORF type:complete len:492 (-),score=108.46 gb/GEZN01003782.1/:465-1940(-)